MLTNFDGTFLIGELELVDADAEDMRHQDILGFLVALHRPLAAVHEEIIRAKPRNIVAVQSLLLKRAVAGRATIIMVHLWKKFESEKI